MLNHYIQNSQLQQEFKYINITDLYVFIEHLELKGYAFKTITDYLKAVLHFSHWWRQKGKTPFKVTIDNQIKFLTTHIPHCHCPHFFPRNKNTVKAALHRWAKIVCVQSTETTVANEAEQLVSQFDDYLANVIGVSITTRLYRRHHVRECLCI